MNELMPAFPNYDADQLITQVVYISRATAHVDHAELSSIASVSASNNSRVGVSGALLFCSGYFLQILEGDFDTLQSTLNRIADDTRHADLQVILQTNDTRRQFADWAMAGLHEDALSDTHSARLSRCLEMVGREDLVDRIGNDALALLIELRDAIGDASRRAA